jgi:MFS family permease
MMLSSLAHLRKTILMLPQAYWFLCGGTLLNRVGMLVLPFLAIYLTSQRHLPSQVVGLIVALPGLGGILASGLLSALADRLPHKYVFVVSLSISACFLLTIPFLSSLFWLAGMVLLEKALLLPPTKLSFSSEALGLYHFWDNLVFESPLLSPPVLWHGRPGTDLVGRCSVRNQMRVVVFLKPKNPAILIYVILFHKEARS